MFASTQTDNARATRVSDAVKKAFEDGRSLKAPAAIARILGGTVDERGPGNIQMKGPGGAFRGDKDPQPESLDLPASLQTLSTELEKEINEGEVEVSLAPRGLVVSLKQAAFFPSGTDAIDPATFPTLQRIAATLNRVSNPVRVEGHTDAVPIHTSRFHSNWELSAARSIAMMELLADRFHVSYQRLAVVGYADTIPVAPNDTAEGRGRNRRVDLVILSDYALAKTQPTKAR
jgi:chemotaxis protein MotB